MQEDIETDRSPQILAPLMATECKSCHNRVYFRFRASSVCPGDQFRTVYLVCPICGQKATQRQEIGADRQVKQARTVYKYRR